MSLVTEEARAKAQVYRGNALCEEKLRGCLKEMGVPRGLLPVKEIEEFGYIEETGFIWLKLKHSMVHKFEKLGKLASYASEITAVADKGKVKKVTGCKVRELLLWITVNEMSVDYPSKGKVTFKALTGISKTFPISAFEDSEE